MTKTKKIQAVLLCILCLFSLTLTGETTKILDTAHPFYDAEILATCLNPDGTFNDKNTAIALKVLKKYIKNDDTKNIFQEIIAMLLKKNPISKKLIIKYLVFVSKEPAFEKNTNLKEFLANIKFGVPDQKKEEVLYSFKDVEISYLSNKINNYMKTLKNTVEGTDQTKSTSRISPYSGNNQDPSEYTHESKAAGKGFLSPVMVADALGTFIADRFKEELTIKYLQKFRDELNDLGIDDLLPETYKFLSSAEIFRFKTFLSTLKSAFMADLKNLDDNIYSFLEGRMNDINAKIDLLNKKIEKCKWDENEIIKIKEIVDELKQEKFLSDSLQTKIKKIEELLGEKEFAGCLRTKVKPLINDLKQEKEFTKYLFFWGLFKEIKQGEHPIKVLGNIESLETLKDFDKECDAVRIFMWATRCISNKEGDGLVVDNFAALEKEFKNEIFVDLYAGLCYAAMARDVKDINLVTNLFKSMDLQTLKPKISKAFALYARINSQIDELKKLDEEGKTNFIQNYDTYLSSIIELFDITDEIYKIYVKNNPTDGNSETGKIKLYLEYARNILEIAKNIHNKDYGLAVANAIETFREVFPKNTEVKKEITRYLTFLHTMATAADSKSMLTAMQSFFLPVQGYRLKRADKFSVTLNSYPGVFVSNENLTISEDIAGRKNAVNLGFIAPVGLSFNFGQGECGKEKTNMDNPDCSLNVFLSVIDLGAIVNFRLTNTDGGLPEFKWKNLFAPGVFVMVGLRNTPISIGGGAQWGPQLRAIKPAEIEGGELIPDIITKSFRVGIVVTVDIPLLRIIR